MRRFVIADNHFGHANIIQYENRPFSNVEEMDKAMIERWNSVVGKEDIVYVLGDFSFYSKEKTKAILSKLKGRKFLIRGNHDRHNEPWYRSVGFERVYSYPIIIDEWTILSHRPRYVGVNCPYINIFGHVHGNPDYRDFSGYGACVSVERLNYTPINIDLVYKNISKEREVMNAITSI